LTTKEVLKVLLRQVGFYQKKAIYFGLAIAAGIGIYFLWHYYGTTGAAVSYNVPELSAVTQGKMDIVIGKNGSVLVDGAKKGGVLKLYEKYDELRILVYDSPGQFINFFQATVHLPADATSDETRQIVYAVHGVGATENYFEDSRTLIFTARDISPSATLTIVADMPKGLVTPGLWQKIEFSTRSLPIRIWLIIAIILPLVTLILMFVMIAKRRSTQLIQVKGFLGGPPENISPALAGVLMDGAVGAREIAATLIDLARRGYIFIVSKGQGQFSFGIRRTGEIERMEGLSPFEKVLLQKIFLPRAIKSTVADVEMRIGRHVFSRKIAQFYLEIYNQATKSGFFVKNPAKVHLAWKYTGIILFFLSFAGFLYGALTGADPRFGLIFWVGGMVAAVVIIRLSPFMPARTNKGNEQVQEWLEFREYLTDRRPATGVESMQGKFEEFLAYAIVLGAEVDWAKRFSQEPFSKPDWYESTDRTVTLGSFAGQIFPLVGYVAQNLARSHEPTVE